MSDEFFYGKCNRCKLLRKTIKLHQLNIKIKNTGRHTRGELYQFHHVISGATLKGANAVVTWNPAEKEEEEFPERANKLILKQILLGVEAVADEYNVVEVSFCLL